MTPHFSETADSLLSKTSCAEAAGVFLKNRIVQKQLDSALKDFDIWGYDWDGCLISSETIMIIAITNVLNNGTGGSYSVQEIKEKMTGKPLDKIFEIFVDPKGSYRLPGTVEENLEKHTEEYLRLIRAYGLVLNEPLNSHLIAAKNGQNPYCFILTNGNKQAINQLLDDYKLDVFDVIIGTERAITDKVKCAQKLVKSLGHSMSDLAWCDDSVKTILNMQDKGVFCVFVRHEFNDNSFVPESGLVVDGHAPVLHKDYPFLCENTVRPMTVGGKWNPQRFLNHKL